MTFARASRGRASRRTAPWGMARGAALALAAGFDLCRVAAADDSAPIRIDNFSFVPGERTVRIGTTLTWRNDDDIPHLVVFSDQSFRSKALDTGDTATFIVRTMGEIPYFCGLHPQMRGKVIVVP